MREKRPGQTRAYMSFVTVILIGLVLGIFMKNVRLGLVIGLVLGLLGSGLLRRR